MTNMTHISIAIAEAVIEVVRAEAIMGRSV